MSLSPPEMAEVTRVGKTKFPRFSRMDVGSNNLISFANAESLALGSRDVVTGIFSHGLKTIPSRSLTKYSGIDDTRQSGIFIIQRQLFLDGPVRPRLIVFEIFS